VRTHPVDKLLEQHCYKSAAGFVTTSAFLRVYTVALEQGKLTESKPCFLGVFIDREVSCENKI
jgi:hypothetical protein